VGLTLVDPLACEEVKLPGMMLMLVAPVVDQLSVLLAPELMLAGLAANAEITGGGAPSDLTAPTVPAQPEKANAARSTTATRRAELAPNDGRIGQPVERTRRGRSFAGSSRKAFFFITAKVYELR